MKLIKSSLLVKLVILILVVYATVTLVKLQSRISDKKAEADALTSSITTAEQENGRLQDSHRQARHAGGAWRTWRVTSWTWPQRARSSFTTSAIKLFGGSFAPMLRFEGLEMHAVCLRPSNLALGQNLSPNMLYSLRACSRKNRGGTQQFQTWGIKRNIWSSLQLE